MKKNIYPLQIRIAGWLFRLCARTMASFNAGLFLTEPGQSLRFIADERTLELELAGTDTVVVENDRQLVYRMAQNLILNVLKYTQQGRVVVNWGEAQDRWWFEVVDTGTGLDPALLARLNLTRSGETRSGEGWIQLKGEGIGLRIVRELAHLLEARLQVSSEAGVGTCFMVSLPLRYATI